MPNQVLKVKAPLSGTIVPLEEIPDPVFSQKLLGDGLGIDPEDSLLLSPVKAEVVSIAKTKHAITLKTEQEIELLIHVGIETVALQGKGFSILVKEGDEVEVGTALLRFDAFELIAGGAKSLISAILVNKTENCKIKLLNLQKKKKVTADKDILYEIIVESKTTNKNSDVKEDETGKKKVSTKVQINDRLGIHARPAARFAELAKTFLSEITIKGGEKTANGKSALSLMSANITYKTIIIIEAYGSDQEQAIIALKKFLEEGLEEDSSKPANFFKEENEKERKIDGLKGLIAARGFSAGVSLVYKNTPIEIYLQNIETKELLSNKEPEEELKIFRNGIEACEQDIKRLIEKSSNSNDKEIFSAHLELLKDVEIFKECQQKINNGKSAIQAYLKTLEENKKILENSSNSLLTERVADLKDLQQRMLEKLTKNKSSFLQLQEKNQDEDYILIAEDLTPSEFIKIISLDFPPVGICLAKGSVTSHMAILASNKGIATLVALGDTILQLPNQSPMIVDAYKGICNILSSMSEYQKVKRKIEEEKKNYQKLVIAAQKPLPNKDNVSLTIAANIENIEDAKISFNRGADALGLVRTEFLFFKENTKPSEQTQFHFYSQIMKAMKGKAVTFRTLDVGGDKPMPYLPLPPQENPLLGLRGIRVSLFNEQGKELFRSQVRAILRLRPFNTRKLLLPMISHLEELLEAKEIIKQEAKALKVELPKLGVMIEVPAAALIAEELASEVDFFSIGSNDLSQYVLALDRSNASLSNQLDAAHPAVLRLIYQSAQAAQRENIKTALCGNLASIPDMSPLLVGLGISELSMSSPMIPEVKNKLKSYSLDACKKLAQKALKAKSASEIYKLLK